MQKRWVRPLLILTGTLVLGAIVCPSLRNALSAALTVMIAGATVAYALLTSEIVNATRTNLSLTSQLVKATETYTSLTKDILDATKDKIEAETRPEIGVHIELRDSARQNVFLIVQNIGTGAARDLSFFPEPQTGPASAAKIVSLGKKYMPPSQKLAYYLGSILALGRDYFVPCILKARYLGYGGKVYEETFQINFSEVESVVSSAVDEIAATLKEIQLKLDRALPDIRKAPPFG